MKVTFWRWAVPAGLAALGTLAALGAENPGANRSRPKDTAPQVELSFPPRLPGGQEMVTERSDEFLKPTRTLQDGVEIARTPPTVDFMYYPGQNYPGKPWSSWGDGLAVEGKYYSSIGDHLAPRGNALVFEYDASSRKLRRLVDVAQVLNLPEGHYTPGKIHGRLDLGEDGWLYFSTHRGSSRATADAFHYRGDWILRHHPADGETQIVTQGPVSKHCIPASVLDPKRLIFYGGTAAGQDSADARIQFFAYDVRERRLLHSNPHGPARYMIFAASSGRVYWAPEEGPDAGTLLRFDPASGGPPVPCGPAAGIRAATQETPAGRVYTVSSGQGGKQAMLQSFDTRTERIESLGLAAVGSQQYITSIDADPTGRYLYYVPGAHGGSELDGAPVVQFDVQTGRKKVIAFLEPFFEQRHGCALKGTFSSALDPRGDKLYITWNTSRGGRAWDACALTVVHLPASERQP